MDPFRKDGSEPQYFPVIAHAIGLSIPDSAIIVNAIRPLGALKGQ